ncbi:hypothetical protein PYCCODRAFT_1440773 [Trametes coccinea BRFM310]|uniref:BRCT domain-containing protein n=1 Tax=Trametes coccinea (strain BRFM310) TaxID=1353009 RepID=A0A1Y2I6L9_TRAC3|nr:hypothetical protein PYCCODRAFT_1440773 [Trametes coccinea BRFM310]
MDKFVTVKKPSSVRPEKDDGKKERQKFRYNPYGVNRTKERKFEDWKDKKRTEKILAPLRKDGQSKPSASALTKHLLNTLGDESNPITNSDIYQRSDHICSAATGHQRGEGRGPGKSYWDARTKKLAEQLPEKPTEGVQVLRNVRIYINGYLENTTDIEMKRIVTLAGGQMLHTASGATHILTSQQLNGAKTQKLLTSKSKNIVHVVRPEWVMDSISAGKRLSEREYSVIKTTNVLKITDMFGAGPSHKTES